MSRAGACRPPRVGALAFCLLALGGLPGPSTGAAGDDVPSPAEVRPEGDATLRVQADRPDAASRAAVARGLDFLRRSQLDSGAIGGKYPVAVTSLAAMAILGAGHGYHDRSYGSTLRGALRFILASSAGGSGYISDDKSKMHGHAYAVLFLCQVYGELPREEEAEVSRAIKDGIRVIERAQNSRTFGWFYDPQQPVVKDEASITICVLQALRAANGIGFTIPKGLIDQAVSYVKRCQDDSGSFRYSLEGGDNHTSYALTVAAVSTLYAAGIYDSPAISRGLDSARRELAHYREDPLKAAGDEFFLYGNVYASQAFYQAGGVLWASWFPVARRSLLRRQESDGSWRDLNGSEFGTAMSLLILEVPWNYLPIFQR